MIGINSCEMQVDLHFELEAQLESQIPESDYSTDGSRARTPLIKKKKLAEETMGIP